MTSDLYTGLYDETDIDTPIWNDLLDEHRDRLAEVGLLHEPPSRPVLTVELPEDPPQPDPEQPVTPDPSHGEPTVTPAPEPSPPQPGAPEPGQPHPSDPSAPPRNPEPTGVALA